MNAEVDRILIGSSKNQSPVSPKHLELLKEAGEIDEEEHITVENAFSSVNIFDYTVYTLWTILREQAIYSGGMVSVPLALDITKVIAALDFFGFTDTDIREWLLYVLLYISNNIFSAQIEVANKMSDSK